MTYCSNCGAEIPEGVKFCPECGEPVKMQAGTRDSYHNQGMPERGSQRNEYRRTDSYNSRNYSGGNNSYEEQGHGLAIGSLVCGIIGVVCWFFGYGSFLSIILGIVGLVLAGNSKKDGNTEGTRTAGFILSLIALIGGVIVFLYLVIALAFVGATVQGLFDILG